MPQLPMLCLAAFLLLTATAAQTYDYAIAGGGTAGLLLAVLLSENASISVIVLEAGQPAPPARH